MTEWIIAKQKPEHDITALVINTKGWMDIEKATYYKSDDSWVCYSTRSYVLEITHYLPIPERPIHEN